MLVVADEIFTMQERQLMAIARLSIPNTLKESTMMKDSMSKGLLQSAAGHRSGADYGQVRTNMYDHKYSVTEGVLQG